MRAALLAALAWAATAGAAPPPLADAHLHYNWDQRETLSPDEAVARLRAAGVVLAVVSSTPSRLALELRRVGGDWIRPFFSPYLTPRHRDTWHRDPAVVEAARAALASGEWFGLGELHLWAGRPPARDNPVLAGLMDLAVEYDVPLMIHTEASSHRFLLPLCESRPRLRLIWAHAGGILPADDVAALLAACPNVWADVSVRDPWRYDTLTGPDGRLLPGWARVVARFPGRFLVGSDPVWNVRRGQSWDAADAGWDHLHELLAYHRRWLAHLPPALARRLALGNARELLGSGERPAR